MKDTETDHSKGKPWDFGENVTACFDDMLQRSIPQYDIMRDVVARTAGSFIHQNSVVIDIGCARGEAIAKIVNSSAIFYGLEYSDPMLKVAQERFIDFPNVRIQKHDLKEGIPLALPQSSVILSVLTIQFIPIEYRQFIFQSIYDHLKIGGCFILIEKVLGSNAYIDRLMLNNYLDFKKENGYSDEQIQRKKLALEGVLVPVTSKWNEELLKCAGFRHLDCIWRWMNFAGWMAIK